MSKSSQSKRKSTRNGSKSQRKNLSGKNSSGKNLSDKNLSDIPQWVWFVSGGVALLTLIVVGVLVSRRPSEPSDTIQPYEALMGVTGIHYDDGDTLYRYPNPAGLEENRRWLPALGDENAPVVVMEFSDLYCGHCRDFNLNSLEGILRDYVATGKVRYVDHYYGFTRSVSEGVTEAEMCAAEQGRYFEFKHALFEIIDAGQSLDMLRAARTANIDVRLFHECRDSGRYRNVVQETIQVQTRGVTATPTFFINGQQIAGNQPDEIRRMIEEALGTD